VVGSSAKSPGSGSQAKRPIAIHRGRAGPHSRPGDLVGDKRPSTPAVARGSRLRRAGSVSRRSCASICFDRAQVMPQQDRDLAAPTRLSTGLSEGHSDPAEKYSAAMRRAEQAAARSGSPMARRSRPLERDLAGGDGLRLAGNSPSYGPRPSIDFCRRRIPPTQSAHTRPGLHFQGWTPAGSTLAKPCSLADRDVAGPWMESNPPSLAAATGSSIMRRPFAEQVWNPIRLRNDASRSAAP